MTARVVYYKQKKTETKIEGRSVIEYFSLLKSNYDLSNILSNVFRADQNGGRERSKLSLSVKGLL